MSKKSIADIELKGKRVLIRVDFNVPIADGKITGDQRIVASLPTINKAITDGAKVILFSHLSRIKSEEDKKTKSLAIVAQALATKLGKKVIFVAKTRGPELETAIAQMQFGDVLLVENTRFEDVKNGEVVKLESKNDPELGKYWASLGDVFINDAFATAHRAHASNVGIAKNVAENAVGFLVFKELEMLHRGLDQAKRPFVAIVGGAKVSGKIELVKNLLTKADKVIIGGGMAYTFLKSQGYTVGTSLVEDELLPVVKEYLSSNGSKIILPVDFAIASEFKDVPRSETEDQNIPDGFMGLDIGTKTQDLFKRSLVGVQTILWNGPMGVAEFENFKAGTIAVAQAIAQQQGAFSIIGGGDSAAIVTNLGFADKFSHVSTGGGASLAFLEGQPLPGVDVIHDK